MASLLAAISTQWSSLVGYRLLGAVFMRRGPWRVGTAPVRSYEVTGCSICENALSYRAASIICPSPVRVRSYSASMVPKAAYTAVR